MAASVFTQMPLVANGNVRPGRFLTLVDGNANFGLCVEATNKNQLLVGISERWTRYATAASGSPTYDDGFIAVAGENCSYRGPMQIAELLLGDTVSNPNIPLTTDNAGRGVPDDPTDGTLVYYGAIALKPGLVNEYVPVWVMPMVVSV